MNRALWLIALYVGTIPAANWMIGNVGICVPHGPCLIHVAPGIMAPSGVLMIGAALVLRDMVQFRFGIATSLACILAGAALSAWIAPPAIALASGAAFLISELADFGVYTPLARRRLMLAVLLSSLVGAIVDSAAFLLIAFGNLEFLLGQVIGKAWMVLASLPIIRVLHGRRAQ